MKVDDSIKVMASASRSGKKVDRMRVSDDIHEAENAFDGYKLDLLEVQFKIENQKDIEAAIRMLQIHKYCFSE